MLIVNVLSLTCRHAAADSGEGDTNNYQLLPKVLQVFLERIAEAAHNMEHFYRDCVFDYTLFNERMRASFYKTQKKRKELRESTGIPVGKIEVVQGTARGKSAT